MVDIIPTTFNITKEEVEEVFEEMVNKKLINAKLQLSNDQIIEILRYVEFDGFLASEVRRSIESSIMEVVTFD